MFFVYASTGTSMNAFRFRRSTTSPASFCSAATRLTVPTSRPLPYSSFPSPTVRPSSLVVFPAPRGSGDPSSSRGPGRSLFLFFVILLGRAASAHVLQAVEGAAELAGRLALAFFHRLDVAFELLGEEALDRRLAGPQFHAAFVAPSAAPHGSACHRPQPEVRQLLVQAL